MEGKDLDNQGMNDGVTNNRGANNGGASDAPKNEAHTASRKAHERPLMPYEQAWEYATVHAGAPRADQAYGSEGVTHIDDEELVDAGTQGVADIDPETLDEAAVLESESAIESLTAVWMRANEPPFDFSIVRRLADRNRAMVRLLEARGVTLEPVDRLPRHLPYRTVLRGIAALQGRDLEDVERHVNRKPQSEYRTRVKAEYRRAPYRGTVTGIDLETTGGDPLRCYIINTGWLNVELRKGAVPTDGASYYSGLPDWYESHPIPFADVHHITWDDVRARPEFREDADLQALVLDQLNAGPYMAHNAAFEHTWFLYFLDGYAEGFKNGTILPIDTREICRKLDRDIDSLPLDSRPASLENWARRRGTLDDGSKEKHLGLADSDLMLRTVLAELETNHLLL